MRIKSLCNNNWWLYVFTVKSAESGLHDSIFIRFILWMCPMPPPKNTFFLRTTINYVQNTTLYEKLNLIKSNRNHSSVTRLALELVNYVYKSVPNKLNYLFVWWKIISNHEIRKKKNPVEGDINPELNELW